MKWDVSGETTERKTGTDFEILSATTGGDKQSVGSRIVAEQG